MTDLEAAALAAKARLRKEQERARANATARQGQAAQSFSPEDIQRMIDELERPSRHEIDRMLAELEGQPSATETDAKRNKLRLQQEQTRARVRAREQAGARVNARNSKSGKTRSDLALEKALAELEQPTDPGLQRFLAELDGKLPPKASGFGHRAKEFFLGDNDPNTQNLGERIGSTLNKAGESLFFGYVGDETSAAVESLLPGVDYNQRRDHYRQQEEVLERDNPGLALGAELAPLAIPATGLANAAARGTNLGLSMLRGGALAGAQGASYGFMEGEGGFQNRLNDAKNAGALSAGLGMAATPVTRGLQRYADHRAFTKAGKQMAKTAPSVDDLTSQATALYGKGEARGQILTRDAAKGLADDVASALKQSGVMRSNGQLITRDADVRRVVQELQDLAQHGLEGNQVKPVRSLFQAAASDRDPTRARIGKILLDKFDDAVKRNAPEFAEGDALYHRAKKVQSVDQMIDLADTSDTANALRREFQKADRKNIKGQTGMTPDEVTAMQRVARGGRAEGLARALGRSAPRSVSGALFSGSTPFVAGSLAGSPGIGAAVGATAMGAGMLGRAYSNRAQLVNALMAKGLMAQGGKMPKAEASLAVREAIARALMGLAPRVGQYNTGTP